MREYIMLLCMALGACSGAQTVEACYAKRLGEIGATRTATLIHRCRNYPSISACPYADGINEKYDRKSEAAKDACVNGQQ